MLLVQPPADVCRMTKHPQRCDRRAGSIRQHVRATNGIRRALAAEYVLKHLNPQDRFNVILFSTGWRVFSNEMESPEQAQGAIDWVRGQEAVGGTDINGALTTALDMAGKNARRLSCS